MAVAALVVSTPCAALNETSPSQALQASESAQEGSLQKEVSMCRAATGLSDASTAIGDTASELSGSPRSISSVAGNVLSLVHSPEGSRCVQDALDKAASDSEQELIASELHGHTIKAMRCPHANHVLQKCISVMPPASLQFMIDELLEEERSVKKMVMHRYGGRIVQQLLRKCPAAQVKGLAEAVLQDAVALSCHTFGNYAVQHLLEFGTAEQKYSLVRTIERSIDSIGRSSSGDGVIAAALTHAAAEDRVWIARAAIQDPSLLSHLAHGRFGHAAVMQILSVLQRLEYTRACQGLMAGVAELKASRYGKKVASYLEAAAGR